LIYTLWKNESHFDENYLNEKSSGEQEAKLPLSVISSGNDKKVAPEKSRATLSGHPSDQSAEVPLSIS
jgi:hypothetical protein